MLQLLLDPLPEVVVDDRVVYATFVDDNEDYFVGAQVLACSLRRAGVMAPLLLLVPRDRPAVVAHLRATVHWARVIDVPAIPPPPSADSDGRFARTWSKLNVWALDSDEWDRIVFIEADCVVLTSRVHELEQHTRHLPAFASDSYPQDTLNSGVIVLRPDLGDYLALRARMTDAPPHWRSEQDLLNDYFGPRWFGSARMLPSHLNWHAWQSVSDPSRAALVRPSVLHFSGVHKPWRQRAGGAPRAWHEVMRLWHVCAEQCRVDLIRDPTLLLVG